MFITLIIALLFAAFLAGWAALRKLNRKPFDPDMCAANTYGQALCKIHDGKCTKLTDAAITTRNLLYKIGTDANHIAVAGATDVTIGTVDDEATAAEESVNVNLLNSNMTHRMVASEAIAAGVPVYQAASGKVADNGTKCVGLSLSAAAADGDLIEVEPRPAAGAGAGNLIDCRIYSWADTSATNAITIAGVAAGDVVLATCGVVAGSVTAITSAVATTNTVTVVLNAAGTTAVRVNIAVFRPVQ